MDMPCNCPECGQVVELNDMHNTTGKICYHSLVCPDCYDELESDCGDDDDFEFEDLDDDDDD